MYISTLAIYSVSYLLIDGTSSQASREKSRRVQPTVDRRDLDRLGPRTVMQERVATLTISICSLNRSQGLGLDSKLLHFRVSMRLLDTVESGDAYEAEVEQRSR